ncbi:MAG: hypothetical protein WC699_13435 [Bacteroidales bacterium]|jgi:uncharacterized protein involved in exopolysaccharide biosynthesis
MNKGPGIDFNWFSKRLIAFFGISLIVVCLAAYLLTSPMFVKPMYQSESLIFVPLTILSKQIEQQGIGFASDREIDAHIQILESGQMRDSLIQRFHLDREFGIDLNIPGGRSNLHGILDSRIYIQKTRFSSVSILVKDSDPERAAEMANAIVDLGNNIKEDLLSANRKGALDYAQTLYDNKIVDVQNLEHKIDSISIISGAASASDRNLLSKLQTVYATELQELAGRKNHLEREQRSFETELPKAYVISKAIPNDHPDSPKRLLITLAAALFYLFIVFVFIIVRRDVQLAFRKN